MNHTTLIESHYFPCLEYVCAVCSLDEILIESCEHYVRQSYRNRCYLNTAQGIHMLVVPVTHTKGKNTIQEIQIDYRQKWQNTHWRTIESAYRNAPYFEFYADELKQIIYPKHESLLDLNFKILTYCLKNFKQPKPIRVTDYFEKTVKTPILDLRDRISTKVEYSQRTFYRPVSYIQVFGKSFVPNLSFLDLLFCEGTHSMEYIKRSMSLSD